MGLAWLGSLDRENGGASSIRAPDRILKEDFSLKKFLLVFLAFRCSKPWRDDRVSASVEAFKDFAFPPNLSGSVDSR